VDVTAHNAVNSSGDLGVGLNARRIASADAVAWGPRASWREDEPPVALDEVGCRVASRLVVFAARRRRVGGLDRVGRLMEVVGVMVALRW
jgi:hypothetical protein